MSVAWLPLLVLSVREKLIWMALILPLISACAAISIMHWSPRAEKGTSTPVDESNILRLFQAQKPKVLLRSSLPAVAISISFVAGLAVLLLRHPLAAGALFSICTFMVVWNSTIESQQETVSGRWSHTRTRSLIALSLLMFIFTADLLLPFLQGRGTRNALQYRRPVSTSAAQSDNPSTSLYSGIILLSPVKLSKRIVPPTPADRQSLGRTFARPIVIPFDGAYWYFKHPSRRPRPDARVVKGDPTKRQIRSTDYVPISMEAHQQLANSIRLNCCRAIRVAVQNADNRLGTISIELLLSDTVADKASAQSLGSRVLQSSENRTVASFNRPPVEETLTFPIPPQAHSKSFDQITVVLQPSQGAVAGARIAIQQFVLVP